MLDISKLSRKLMRRGEEAIDIEPVIKIVLDEFFIETVDGYYNERCEFDLEHYQKGTGKKSKAGIASGKARRKKAKELQARGVNASSKGTSVEQVLNTDEQVSTTKNDNDNEEPLTSHQGFDEKDMSIAKHIYTKLKEMNEKQKEPNFNTWAKDVNKIHRLDERTHLEIMEVFNWANSDDFWCTNILSPSKLRLQFDTLTIKMGAIVKQESKLKLPFEDEQLWPYAKKHGLPKYTSGENFKQYRPRLQREIDLRSAK